MDSQHSDKEETASSDRKRPSEETMQLNISRFYELRREYYKYTVGIATALLAFTISFPPSLTAIESKWLINVAWATLALAIMCGVILHYVWSLFYISFRDFDNKYRRDAGKKRRRFLTLIRRTLEVVLPIALLAGVAGVAAFASANLDHVVLKSDTHGTAGK
jgi:heme/copper-type cytochrome/quinol oxidase subunit 2